MLRAGTSQKRIARTLKAAYADGLLSEETFVRRLDQLLGPPVVDPRSLIGDLNLRATYPDRRRIGHAIVAAARRLVWSGEDSPVALLALDWDGGVAEMVLGRHHTCDVVLEDPGVSRRHAWLRFRDGSWVLQDLDSTNGTRVNDVRVGRCELRPGDVLVLGGARLRVD